MTDKRVFTSSLLSFFLILAVSTTVAAQGFDESESGDSGWESDESEAAEEESAPSESSVSRTSSMAGYASRSITLSEGRLRIDVAPPDYGYMEHGEINGNGYNGSRGFQISDNDFFDTFVGLGAGASYGIMDELEAGLLLLPMIFSPDFDIGDLELYGRYAFLQGDIQVAAQLTLMIPALTDFGMGLGAPVLIKLTDTIRLDTGLEFEFIFADDTRVNLDIPAAFSFEVADIAFVGPRTGFLISDMDDLSLNLGVFGGVNLADGMVDVTGSFNWPLFLSTISEDAFNLDIIDFIVGATIYLDILS